MSESKAFAKDPTCGMSVDIATAIQSERDGKIYYFCSKQCQEQFLAVSSGKSETIGS